MGRWSQLPFLSRTQAKGKEMAAGTLPGWQPEGPQGRSFRNEAGDQKEAGLQQLAEGPQEGTSGGGGSRPETTRRGHGPGHPGTRSGVQMREGEGARV